jgi:hypothetical protein
MKSFISLIDRAREDTVKNEDFIKQLQILTRKEGGKGTELVEGGGIQNIKKKEDFIVMDWVEALKVEHSSNECVGCTR